MYYYDYNNPGQLFKLIRNTLAHISDTTAKKEVKMAFGGDTFEDYIHYINGKFPWLLIFAQTIIDRASE